MTIPTQQEMISLMQSRIATYSNWINQDWKRYYTDTNTLGRVLAKRYALKKEHYQKTQKKILALLIHHDRIVRNAYKDGYLDGLGL